MEKIDFNRDWEFQKQGEAHRITVTTPHDAMLYEKRHPACESGAAGAYFPGGIYEYTKSFVIPAEWNGKQILVEFEGVYRNAVVLINEKETAKIVYGYTTSVIDISSYLDYGAENSIRVVVDNHEVPNSRWYSGSGIFRPVFLYVLESCRIEYHGVRIVTKSYDPAVIEVSTAHHGGVVRVNILESGSVVASQTGDTAEITIPNAKLWSDREPHLYKCQVLLEENGHIVEERNIPFGIRRIEWSAKGLFVNGKETLLRGGCLHHDNGILGACAFDEAEERRVRIMKENGFNAIRSAHNPCSRAMLEACDRIGMYVVDETWDMWYQHKSKYDYASDFMEHYKDDIRSMVEKDFNHPSVIFYSIGNEIAEPAKERGLKLAEEMISYLHELDDSRAVTAGVNLMIVANAARGKEMYKEDGGMNTGGNNMSGMNSTMFNMLTQKVGSGMNKSANSGKADKATSPILDALDVAGYNYASGRYPLEGKKHAGRVIFGSETFPQDIAKNWKMVEQYPYLIGDFMWTAFDYLGEVGLGAWSYHEDAKAFEKPYPWLLGGAGVIDIIGHADGEALWARAVWGLNDRIGIAVRPVNHPGKTVLKSSWRGTNAIPSWSWRGCEGNPAIVEVYTKSKRVELFLNGTCIGKKKTKNCKCEFKVTYQPGVLEAIGYDDNGRELERGQLKSALGELKIRLMPEKERISPGDIVYINVDICDESGIIESNADEKITFAVENAEILGFGSANPRTEESYVNGNFTSFHGRALAAIRVKEDANVKVRAVGETLGGAELELL